MDYWFTVSEILRNVGLIAGGAFGLYLGWRRVRASIQQADAQTR